MFSKVWQIEKVGWYRENSVRFVRLTNWRPLSTLIFMFGVFPLVALHWSVASKTTELHEKGIYDREYRTIPFRRFDPTARGNGGHPADYRGPEEWLKYKKY